MTDAIDVKPKQTTSKANDFGPSAKNKMVAIVIFICML